MNDKLEEIFNRQRQFMDLLVQNDKLPEYPVSLMTKGGQRQLKETVFNVMEELMEASFTLKNRVHKMSNDNEVDVGHYKEELGDALAYFVELCIQSGISASELFDEYCKKNKVVVERLENGY